MRVALASAGFSQFSIAPDKVLARSERNNTRERIIPRGIPSGAFVTRIPLRLLPKLLVRASRKRTRGERERAHAHARHVYKARALITVIGTNREADVFFFFFFFFGAAEHVFFSRSPA